jgi:hypothetical protein
MAELKTVVGMTRAMMGRRIFSQKALQKRLQPNNGL